MSSWNDLLSPKVHGLNRHSQFLNHTFWFIPIQIRIKPIFTQIILLREIVDQNQTNISRKWNKHFHNATPWLSVLPCVPDEPPMSELSHSNGIYSGLSDSSLAMGGRQESSHGPFPLEHGVLQSQDQYHNIRSSSPYGLPQSPVSLQALPRHQPPISSLVYPDSGLSIMTQGGAPGLNPGMRGVLGGTNGPSSDLSTGSSGGYPDFPASPASWLDEVDHGQFWWAGLIGQRGLRTQRCFFCVFSCGCQKLEKRQSRKTCETERPGQTVAVFHPPWITLSLSMNCQWIFLISPDLSGLKGRIGPSKNMNGSTWNSHTIP